jgi:hypothetical protein
MFRNVYTWTSGASCFVQALELFLHVGSKLAPPKQKVQPWLLKFWKNEGSLPFLHGAKDHIAKTQDSLGNCEGNLKS